MGEIGMLEEKKIDKNTPIPLYFQLKSLLLAEIEDGTYLADSLIPTEKELCDMFHISRTTVRQALAELVQEGYLYRVKSKGTFVARPKIRQDFMQKLESFNEQIIRTHRVPSTEVLGFGVMSTPYDVAVNLGIKENEKVIYLHRRRFADTEPIVVLQTFLPYDYCSFILEYDFTKESLYGVLKKDERTEVAYIKRVVEAVEATSDDAEKLNLQIGKPIQYFKSVGYSIYGKAIEVSYARYRGDRNSFEITISAERK